MEKKKNLSRREKILVTALVILTLFLCVQTFYVMKISRDQKDITTLLARAQAPARTGAGTLPGSPAGSTGQTLFDSDRWDPFAEIENMHRQINRLFRNTLHRGGLDYGFDAFRERPHIFEPTVDMNETDKEYIMAFDLPGVDKDKIEITIENGYLSVSGKRQTEEQTESDDQSFYRMERSFGAFNRALPLPGPIREDQIQAEYADGVLTIRLPKRDEQKDASTSRTIPVM
jgi:HSP20 family protein